MALKQHEFYVYHEENRVMARRRTEAPVIAEEYESFQAAHDRVQEIVNPTKAPAAVFGPLGYNNPDYLAKISENCREFVEAAYAKAGG